MRLLLFLLKYRDLNYHLQQIHIFVEVTKKIEGLTNTAFSSWLENPSSIDMDGVDQLQKMVDQYPYTSVFQILLTKGLHNLGDLSLDAKLRTAAVSVPDRGMLYQVLYAQKLQDTIFKINQSLEVENIKQAELKNEVDNEVVVTKVEVTEIEIPKNIHQTKAESILDVNEQNDNKDLEEDILIEAINNSLQLDVGELLQEMELEKPPKDLVDSPSKKVVKEDDSTLKPQKFSDWLLTMKENDAPIEEIIEEKPKDLLSSKDLIDRFISQKNKKIKISEEPITPKELGQLSLVENEDFVTETLANIYAKQGKYDKAIKIFEQLMLNFPEKNTFFASRIRFLREKMEYDK